MGVKRLLSFKKIIESGGREECVEYLDDHIDYMLKYYEELYVSTNWNRIVSKRLGVNEHVVDSANRIAIVYHDLGKAFFQEKIMNGKGARYHEYFSVVLLNDSKEALSKKYLGIDDEKVYLSIVWSILAHHLSLRHDIDKPSRILYNPSYVLKKRQVSLHEDYASAISQIIRDKLGVEVSVRSGIYEIREMLGLARDLELYFKKYYPLALRISRILITTDTLAACDLRCDKDYRVYVADIPKSKAIVEARRLLREWLRS